MDKNNRAAELLDRIGRIVHGLQFSQGLNPAQWEALRFLARANRYSRSPTALAEYLGTTKGTTSQTLIALESKGAIKRSRRACDRRSVELEITRFGLDELQAQAILEMQLRRIAALERSALRSLLRSRRSVTSSYS